MNFNEYQKLAQRTSNSKTPSGKIENGCLGLAGESGECCDLLKKYLFQGHELENQRLTEELGDVLWYAAELASGLGMTLSDIAEANIKKLKSRYPDGFDVSRSLNREE
mgnify:CR=1 FL=1